jgi:cardiolipin synthase A/B
MNMPEELMQKLVRLAQNLSLSRLENLSGKFLKTTVCPEESTVTSWIPVSDRSNDLQEIGRLWSENPCITGEMISSFLRGAWCSWQTSASDQQMHMLISGPRTHRNTIRSLGSEIYHVIEKAEKQLLLVTYVAHPPEELINVLKDAEARGVAIELIFETPEDSDYKLSFTKIEQFFKSLDKVSAYHWPLEARTKTRSGSVPSLHAKFVLADDEHLVVSSANLTEYALENNIELGVLISGGDQPKAVRRYYNELIRERHLEKYTPSITD